MSETTTTTGWHRHADGTVHRNGPCDATGDARPVVVFDAADPAVRETISRALHDWLGGYGVTDAGPTAIYAGADAVLAALASATEGAGVGDCGCYACIGDKPTHEGSWLTVGMTRMIVCATCGNKRCPHGTDHRNACTGSNEPNQEGSRYQYPADPSQPGSGQ